MSDGTVIGGGSLLVGGAGLAGYGLYQAHRRMVASDDLANRSNLHGWANQAELASRRQEQPQVVRAIRDAVHGLGDRFEQTGQHDVARVVRAAAAHPDLAAGAAQMRGVAATVVDESAKISGHGGVAGLVGGALALITGAALVSRS